MSGSNLVVKISAADKFSKAFGALGKSLSGAGNAVGSFAKDSGTNLARMSKAVTHLSGSAAKAGVHMTEALAPLGILTGALSAAGFGKMVSDWARFSQSLTFNATRIGVGVSQLQALEGSAQLAGSSASAAAGGLQTLQDTMVDTVGGRNMEALVYFRQLGVAFQDGTGHALRATTVLPKLADAIARIKDPSLQARVATQFFGGAAESLLPWLRKGSAGMAEYAALAKHYGVETEDSTEKAGVFRFAQERLVLAFKGLGNSISAEVSPPLSKMMTFLAELIACNRGLIADKFGSWAKQLGDWIQSIDWGKTTKYFVDLFDRFERWTDAMSKFTVPSWMKKLFGLGDDTPGATGGAPGAAGGVNGPLSDDNPNAPGSPAFYKAHPEIKPPGDRSFFHPPTLPPFWGGSASPAPQGDSDTGKRMLGYFEGRGWTHAQAAGIVANLDRESSLTADRTGDSGRAYGLGQWHPDRQANFAQWAGHDIRGSTLDEQMQFVQYELTHGERRAGDILKTAPNAATAAYVVNSDYERPKDVAGENTIRGGLAEKWAALQSDDLLDGPLRGRLEGQSKHEVVIKVQAAPGTQASATATGTGAASVRIAHSMVPGQ
jgi:hypothetical protein